ncbi:uncharacterized protein L3040_000143 [Drepanopeziza brunnea f. sp. 'multigermtubi']|uniref:uncharacterized protein n=1 Tax=Drepanopeziza brunnea f. sp. 'multigermtubi' TaxID=698441 RepID=UPI00238D3BF1|nr:hypothetical protein L3040_000143 [Drepanopeziza brunnea f. sp. 'multigermtubi']
MSSHTNPKLKGSSLLDLPPEVRLTICERLWPAAPENRAAQLIALQIHPNSKSLDEVAELFKKAGRHYRKDL